MVRESAPRADAIFFSSTCLCNRPIGLGTSMAAATVAAGGELTLLVGVMSYRSPVALGRRQAMRALMRPTARTSLRFVMASSTLDADSSLPDVLTFTVNQSTRSIGTYLLNNAFFRYAVALRPLVPFIARADDDSFFDLSTVLAELLASSSCAATLDTTLPRESRAMTCSDRHVIYGDFKEWYMWSPRSMMAGCFDFSQKRHELALKRLDDVGGDAKGLPRFQRECLHADLVGPYPFAKGPLVAYSRNVAAALVALPELDEDEGWATSARISSRLRNPITGALYEPRQVLHPHKSPLYDDIYFGYLTLRALATKPLLLVNARLSEFDKGKPLRLDTQRGFVRIYHKLKTGVRFGWIANHTELPDALRHNVRSRFQCTRQWKALNSWYVRNLDLTGRDVPSRLPEALSAPTDGGLVMRSKLRANLTQCCHQWFFCFASSEGVAGGRLWQRG